VKRRFFLFAAPAIVAAPSLMRVSAAALPKVVGDAARYTSDFGPISDTFMAKYTWKNCSVDFYLESNGVQDWWTRPARADGYAPSDLVSLMRSELEQMHRSLYADGNSDRRFGLASLLSDEEYAQITADVQEDA
jgi:hypothetical protein